VSEPSDELTRDDLDHDGLTHDELMASLREAARRLTEDRGIRDLDLTLDRLVHSAVVTIPKVEGGGISRTDGGTVSSGHATSDEIHALDQLQSRLGEGPCVTAADAPPASGVVLAQDLAGDDAARWPRFAPAAAEAGYRALMSVALSVHGATRSALNLYAHDPGVFDPSAQLTAGLFGLQAAMLLHGADHAAQLGHALETRDVIGQAKGILMERFTVDDDEAFRLLVTSSQDTNMKLVEVARWLTREAIARRARSESQVPPAIS
jgi:hypothetical protein